MGEVPLKELTCVGSHRKAPGTETAVTGLPSAKPTLPLSLHLFHPHHTVLPKTLSFTHSRGVGTWQIDGALLPEPPLGPTIGPCA